MCLRFSNPGLYAGTLLLALMGLVSGGCASQQTGSVERKAEVVEVADSVSETSARAALVEVEADVGFTVTEVVSISSGVRADHAEALNLLAQENYEQGISLMLEVINKVPDATGPLVDLGIAYSRAGDYERAESSFNDALTLTANHPVAHNELGIVHRKLGRFAAARQSYERALEIYPGFHYARRNLAVLCDLYLADLTCALEHYQIYRASVPQDREVDIWIGDLRNRIVPADQGLRRESD